MTVYHSLLQLFSRDLWRLIIPPLFFNQLDVCIFYSWRYFRIYFSAKNGSFMFHIACVHYTVTWIYIPVVTSNHIIELSTHESLDSCFILLGSHQQSKLTLLTGKFNRQLPQCQLNGSCTQSHSSTVIRPSAVRSTGLLMNEKAVKYYVVTIIQLFLSTSSPHKSGLF